MNIKLQKEILTDIHQQHIEAAYKINEVQNELDERLMNSQIEIINKRKEKEIKKYYNEKDIQLVAGFEDLIGNPQVEEHRKIFADSRPEYNSLMAKSKQKPKQTRNRQEQLRNPDSVTDNLENLLKIAAATDDISDLNLFADYAFIYHGNLVEANRLVEIKTRTKKPLRAKIYCITELVITFEFEFGETLSVNVEDIDSGKVVLTLLPVTR